MLSRKELSLAAVPFSLGLLVSPSALGRQQEQNPASGTWDQAIPGQCIPGSSVPALGFLVPLSADLNLARSGSSLRAPVLTITGAAASQKLGWSVAGVGDMDSDGHEDWAVGVPLAVNGSTNSGRIILHSGRDGSVLRTWTGGLETGAELGFSVASAGDVDADGVPDLIAGLPRGVFASTGFSGEARVFSGRTGDILLNLPGIRADDKFGYSVASTGDIDGDGSPDLVVGGPSPGSGLPGYARVFSGANGALLFQMSGASSEQFGFSVGRAGPYLLVGSPANSQPLTNAGQADAFSTRSVGIGTTAPSEKLTVAGTVQSLSGGLVHPDGTVQLSGSIPGPPGPEGPQGPAGPQGPPATSGVLTLNGIAGPSVAIAGGTGVTVSASGSTVTVGFSGSGPTCIWPGTGRGFSPGSVCYSDVSGSGCSFGFRGKINTCTGSGTWSQGNQITCQNPSPIPLCDFL